MHGDCRSSFCWLTTLAVGLGAPSGPSCSAGTGVAAIIVRNADATMMMEQILARCLIMVILPLLRMLVSQSLQHCSNRNALVIGGDPTPCARTVAALHHALLVDFGDDRAIARQQRLGRAHLGANRQLALGETVGAVFGVFGRRRVGLRSAGAIGALVHLAAGAEIADLRILRRAERAGVEAVAAADAEVLGVQHHAVGGGVEARHRADRGAWRIGAMHARHRHRALAGLAVVDGDDAAAIDAPRHFMFVLAGRHAGVALDAAVGITEKLDASHDLFSPHADWIWHRVTLPSCMPVTGS